MYTLHSHLSMHTSEPVRSGNLDMVELLLRGRADPNVCEVPKLIPTELGEVAVVVPTPREPRLSRPFPAHYPQQLLVTTPSSRCALPKFLLNLSTPIMMVIMMMMA